MPLSNPQQAELAQADSTAIEGAFTALGAHWAAGSWIAANNRYRVKCTKRLATDLNPGKHLNSAHLRDYIAASTVTHCADGWSFLGRAIDCHMRGDEGASVHLAYYAELRAAMALLAAAGVGVFSNEHFYVNAQGRCQKFSPARQANNQTRPNGPGTHKFTWEALEHWAGTAACRALLFDIFYSGGRPIAEWYAQFNLPQALQQSLVQDWLKNWGLDLQRLENDRDARNLVSYRPSAFTVAEFYLFGTRWSSAADMWGLCEPGENSRFRRVDRFLVRMSLELFFSHGLPTNTSSVPAHLPTDAGGAFARSRTRELTEVEWLRFLLRETEPTDPLLFREAAGRRAGQPGHHRQVLARATLLLRTATGAAGRSIRMHPNATTANLEFSWESFR